MFNMFSDRVTKVLVVASMRWLGANFRGGSDFISLAAHLDEVSCFIGGGKSVEV